MQNILCYRALVIQAVSFLWQDNFSFSFHFPPATFEIYSLFQWKRLKNGNLSKVAGGSNFNKFLILLRSFQGLFWKEDIQGYLILDSYFEFHNLVCVWECIKDYQKKQFCQVAKFRGCYRLHKPSSSK